MKKLMIIILSFLVLVTLGFDIYLVYRHHNRKEPPQLDVIPYEHFYMPQEPINTNLTNQEIKVMLDSLYNITYSYKEQELSNTRILAETNNNTIIIKPNLDPSEYITTLSHELTHLKYKTNNETFTEYQSLITLYDSGNILFRKVALNRAKLIISGAYENTEYDCGYYLLNYLTFS